MSLSARLHIEGHEQYDKGIKVLSCSFNFSQDTDNNGKVASIVKAGIIYLTIPGINDAEIVHWMLVPNLRKKGKITYSGVVDTGPRRSIEFEDAILVNYSETFKDETDIIIQLGITCRKIKISGKTYEMQWDTGDE